MMAKIVTVNRIKSNDDATLSTVSIDDKFFCFGLEDEYRENKIAAETRIPAGEYQLKLREHGGFHNRYKDKFVFHRGMIEVCDVPNFTDILIHIGNTDKDTAGCLLVGMGATVGLDDISIQSSRIAYISFYNEVVYSVGRGDAKIIYIDSDR